MCAVSLEVWNIRRLGEYIAAGRINPDYAQRSFGPDTDQVVAFFEAIRARQPLGSIILAEHSGEQRAYDIVDGRVRIEALARVLRADLYAEHDTWPVHLRPADQGGGLAPGVSHDPCALPLQVISTTLRFLTWANAVATDEPDYERGQAALQAAHAACRLLGAPIPVYVVRGADRDTLRALREKANQRIAT